MPKKKEPKKKPSKSAIPIDWEVVDWLFQCGCDGTEIAARLGINKKTLYRAVEREHGVQYGAYKAQKRASGDSLIKEKQMEHLMDGDRAMAMYLGKVRLGQSEKPTTTQSNEIVEALTQAINKAHTEHADGN